MFEALRNPKNILIFIVVLMIILWFGGIFNGDIYSDNALNSFRSLGWYDRLVGGQTQPIDWFGSVPWWGNLSFHDAPPLVFFIQFIFFAFLGPTIFAAKLPFMLAGFASFFAIYFFLKKIAGVEKALLASFVFAINAYAIWAGQFGFLEGIEQFFILLAFFFLYRFIQERSSRHLYLYSASLSLALISKYTSIFLLPAGIFLIPWVSSFLFKKEIPARQVQKKENQTRILNWRNWAISAVIFFLILSPVIVYNSYVYSSRGHFDAALSSMVGMHPSDFSIISQRKANFDLIGNFEKIFGTLWDSNSRPFVILNLLGIVWLIFKAIKNKGRGFETFLLTHIVLMLFMFASFGGGVRFLSIITPFISIALAVALVDIFFWLKNLNGEKTKKIFLIFYCVLISVVLLFEVVYSFNSNVLANSFGSPGILYSPYKQKNLGFNQLEAYLKKENALVLPVKQKIKTLKDISIRGENIKDRSVVIFDDRMHWFAQYWYFQKYFNFYRLPVFSTAYLDPDGTNLQIEDLISVSGKPLYFIYPVDSSVMDPNRMNIRTSSFGSQLVEQMDKLKIPYEVIKNKQGTDVFKVYKISVKK